jgi:hypothetical protein
MEINRREFLALSSAVAQGSVLAGLGVPSLLGGSAEPAAGPGAPWHQRVRRVGQLNFNERDPVELDVAAWADYWAGDKVDAVLISVTGILAFYPTQVPYHRRSRFLGDRDLFGECAAAARKRGIRVIARMSPDLNWEDATRAHPEWFTRDAKGAIVAHGEGSNLYHTCMFTSYFTDYVPAIMREINSRYEVDAFYTNGWPPLDGLPVCYCEECRRLAPPNTVEYWEQFTERVAYLWKSYDGIAKEKKPDSIFFANLGSGMRATPNLKRLSAVAEWFNCDNQGRGGDATPIWGAAQQGRVATAIMKGRTITNVTGAYATGSGTRWRNAAKNRAESEIWMDQTAASGMTLWYHWLGGQTGMGEDRRWQKIGRRHMEWLAKNDRHFERKGTVANVAVVMGQRSHLFYTPPGEGGMGQFMDGLYGALIEGRFMFDFVHEEDLGPETVGKYTAILVPGVAWLSDKQCQQLRDFVDAGGSLMASFEAAMFDEKGRRRGNSGLADIFGIDSVGPVAGPLGNGFYARIERPHEILEGFNDTNWIPGGAYRLPVKAAGPLVLSVVPPYTAYPPELSYAPVARTDEPAVVVRERGRSRLLYFPGDLERSAWRYGDTDLSRLIQNSVTWLTRDVRPVSIEGDGVLDCIAWETVPGYAVHMVNYTNPNMHRGWLRRHYPVGEQRVTMAIPGGKTVTRVELLRAGREIAFRSDGGSVVFTVPEIQDYEVAAVFC